MNLERLRSILGPEGLSTAPEDQLVYERDASHLKGECLAVTWPSHPEQVIALVEWAQGEGVDLVPRGAGTGLCGGAVPQRSVVVDLSRLTRLDPLDDERGQIRVGAGVALDTLNRYLSRHDLFLPVIPGSHRAASIGGMIATDAAGLRAVHYGTMRAWVEEVTLIDGRARLHRCRGAELDDVVGREGVTGIIVEAVLRVAPLPRRRTALLMAFDDEDALLAQRSRWRNDPQLTALEYINRHAAAVIGWEARPHLLAEFASDAGTIRAPEEIAALWRARDGLYPALAARGHTVIEDPQLTGEGLASLLSWLNAEGIPAFGHLGVGIIHPCLQRDDPRIRALYERVIELGGRVSGEHGIGLKKRAWVDEAFRARIQALKRRYDPQGIINRGKLC